MSLADGPALLFARGAATVGLGLVSGYMFNISSSGIDNIFAVSTLAPRDRLHLWSRMYSSGAAFMIPALPSISLLLAGASYFAKSPPLWTPASWVAKHRSGVLGTAAFITFAILPYTVGIMMPAIKTMKEVEKKIEADPSDANGTVETDTLIQRWLVQHHVRTVMSFTAFVLVVSELISA